MNTERIMKVIAEELGVELGEWFAIDGDEQRNFVLDKNGLYDNELDRAYSTLADLVYCIRGIKKLPWEPKPGEIYWTVIVEREDPIYPTNNCGLASDKRRIERGFAFKTFEEAVAKANEMGILKEGEYSCWL